MASDFITTYSGIKFHFDDPKPEEVAIVDIAYALANTYRWGGHACPNITVAQHSVIVCDMLLRRGYDAEVGMQGLLHDAAEAYLGDIPTPIKSRLPEFQAMELLVESAIFEHFGISLPMHPAVKLADLEARRWEYRDLMSPNGGVEPPEGNHPSIPIWDNGTAAMTFLGRFHAISEALAARNKECA